MPTNEHCTAVSHLHVFIKNCFSWTPILALLTLAEGVGTQRPGTQARWSYYCLLSCFMRSPPINLLDIIILLQGAPGTPLQHLSVIALVTSPWDLCWFVLWFCFLCLRITSRYTIIAEAFEMQFLILKVNYPVELPTDFKVCSKLQSLCRLCWEF